MKNFYHTLLLLLGLTFSTATYAETEVTTNEEGSETFVTAENINPYEKSLEFNVAEALTNAQPQASPKMDLDFFKSKTNPGVKPYKFLDDLTFVGVPLFIAGWAVKGDKAMFRVNDKNNKKKNTQLLTDFKTSIDDYTQFFGPAMVVGLKIGGVEGRSDWPRLLASSALSYGIMAAFVNGIKYTAKEMRPDGSTANSWPSGHTATSFVGATILHKEYGLTRSPWYSVAGYGVATATGVMRVLNNRHWISDVMSGAGLGIISTEFGYAFADLMFKGKGLLRNDLYLDNENPSFFAISMGIGLGSKNIDFTVDDIVDKEIYGNDFLAYQAQKEQIKFRSATVVDAEGAYFFNKYIGVGGRLRVRAMSAKSFGDYASGANYEDLFAWSQIGSIYEMADPNWDHNDPIKSIEQYYNRIGYDVYNEEKDEYPNAPVSHINGIVRSDHISEFTGSVGLYFNLPLSKYFSLGTKALIGRSITQELDIDGQARGNLKNINYELTIKNGEVPQKPDGTYMATIDYPENYQGQTYTDEWDYLTVGANNSTSFGTGLSLTYKYKSNFSWRIFIDYDYTKKTYTMKYDPYHFLKPGLTPQAYDLVQTFSDVSPYLEPVNFRKEKKMNYFTLGGSFVINF